MTASQTVTEAGSGLVFINTYGSGVTQSYINCVVAAENALQSAFQNSVTINVDFEISNTGKNNAAQNSYSTVSVSYAQLEAALASHATTAAAHTAVANLPTTDPSNGAGFALSIPEAVILGLAPQTNALDLTVTLNSSLSWQYGQDVTGVLEHELTEGGFGRVSSLGVADSQWAPLDLFRFTASGARDYTGGKDGVATYFGVSPTAVTAYQFHNALNTSGTNDGQDFGDWDAPRGDVFGGGGPGVNNVLSATDLEVLNVLGWTPTGTAPYSVPADTLATSVGSSLPYGFLGTGAAQGDLGYAGDRQVYQVQLYQGVAYTITETGQHGGGGTLADPYLYLLNSSGAVVASDDDIASGTNPDSQITFSPASSGTYYVQAAAFGDGYTGSYTLTVAGSATLPSAEANAVSTVLRAPAGAVATGAVTAALVQGNSGASPLTTAQAVATVVQAAQGTTDVATLAYQFFTGSSPTAAGLDYLVSPNGANPDNLNSAYYQTFNIENRFINFAVNLGVNGAGAQSFAAAYGGLDLPTATSHAYQTIFGTAPTAEKVSSILNTDVTFNGVTETRAQYFAGYGGGTAIGTAAAMVGWLLAEAVTSNVGDYALSNAAFLTAVANGTASYGVNIIGQYDQSAYHYTGG